MLARDALPLLGFETRKLRLLGCTFVEYTPRPDITSEYELANSRAPRSAPQVSPAPASAALSNLQHYFNRSRIVYLRIERHSSAEASARRLRQASARQPRCP